MRPTLLIALALFLVPVVPVGTAAAQVAPAAGGIESRIELRNVDRSTLRIIAVSGAEAHVFESSRTHVRRLSVRPRSSHGTGVVVDGEGIIVTARHVTEGADFIAVLRPGSDEPWPAELLYVDPDRDLAFLRVGHALPHHLTMPQAPRTMRVSEPLSATGYPLDIREQYPAAVSGELSRETRDGSLQASMSVNPGHSGGPVIDAQDRLIGIISRRGRPQAGVEGVVLMEPLRFILPAYERARVAMFASEPQFTEAQAVLARVAADFVRTSDERPLFEQTTIATIDAAARRPPSSEAGILVAAHAWNMHIALLEARNARDIANLNDADRALASRLAETAVRLTRHYIGYSPYLRVRYPVVRAILANAGRAQVPEPSE